MKLSAAVLWGVVIAAPATHVGEARAQAAGPGQGTCGTVFEPNLAFFGGGFSRVLFVDDCLPGGCTIRRGTTDARTDTSSIPDNISPGQTTLLGPFDGSPADWADFMLCLRETLAPYDIDVTDVDPGNTTHTEIKVAGNSADIGQASNTLGIAPFNCGYIPNALGFAFAEGHNSMIDLCSTAAHEAGHTWGLDHEFLAADPMTYLDFNGQRSFQDQAARCGEFQIDGPRDCSCGGDDGVFTTQNSHEDLLATFGSSDPTPPTVEITTPMDNAQVGEAFVIRATATDDLGVVRVELWIDGAMIETTTLEPYVFNAPASLDEGPHDVEIRAYDSQDTLGSDEVTVILGEPCDIPGDCVEIGEGFTCVGGRCVPGDGVVGGLGTECENGRDCFSGICANDGTRTLCGEVCEPEAGQCPSGYGCLPDNNGSGVCWPGIEEGGCGGCAGGSGGSSALPIALGLGFVALLAPRRRRRRTT